MSQAGKFIEGNPTPGVDVLTLEGDLGGPVGPDMSGNINVIADNASVNAGSSVLIVGNPGTNTLTLNVTDVNNGTLIGLNAGNLTISGINNTGVGHLVLNALTSGANNTALGADAATLITSSSGNTAVGSGSLSSYVTGTGQNTALGLDALRDLASGSANTAIGYQAMEGSSSNTNSVAVGYQSLRVGTGVGNTTLGAQAGTAVSTGAANTLVGFQSGLNLTTGNTNIFVGNLAGQNITTSGNNICIGSGGVLGDSGAIRIGANGIHTSAFMQGIAGVTVANPEVVVIDSVTGQLGTDAGGTTLQTLTGDTGGAIPPTAGNINIITDVVTNNSGATVEFEGIGVGSIIKLNVTDTTLENTFVGNSVGNATVSGTQNTGFGCAGTLGALTSGVNNIGIGVGALPAVTSGAKNIGIGTSAGLSVVDGEFNIFIGDSSGGAVVGSGANTAIGYNSMASGDSSNNTFVGFGAGNQSGSGGNNTAVGYQVLGNSPGFSNVAMGANAMFNTPGALDNVVIGSGAAQVLTGQGNVAVGYNSMSAAGDTNFNVALGNSTLQSVSFTSLFNVAIGNIALSNLVSGNGNIAIGNVAGENYTGGESFNILCNNSGVLGESNTLRIGSATGTGNFQLSRVFIHGINGNTVSNSLMVTIDSSTSQLGTQAIPTGMMTWTVVTGSSQAMAANNGYIANNAGTINFSLPASSAVGDIIRITGINNATGWQISQAAGQQIFFGTSSTTSGATGTITSSATRDSIEIVCVVANTIWNVLSVIGNPTIV